MLLLNFIPGLPGGVYPSSSALAKTVPKSAQVRTSTVGTGRQDRHRVLPCHGHPFFGENLKNAIPPKTRSRGEAGPNQRAQPHQALRPPYPESLPNNRQGMTLQAEASCCRDGLICIS